MWEKDLRPSRRTVWMGFILAGAAGIQIFSAYNAYQRIVYDSTKALRDRSAAFTRTLEVAMQAEYQRGTLSVDWLQHVLDDLIVDWGEPRALRVERVGGAEIARAGNVQLFGNVESGRIFDDDKALFVDCATIQLPGKAVAQPGSANSPEFPDGSYRISLVIDAGDAYFAGEFAWISFLEMIIPWAGFVVSAFFLMVYYDRLHPQTTPPHFNIPAGGMSSETPTRL